MIESIQLWFAEVPWLEFALTLQWLFLGYFLAISASYLALNYISLYAVVGYMRDHRAEYLPKALTAYQPPVSILLPAFSEQGTIVSSVRSLLQLNYPRFEIIIINDGSSDNTLDEVISAFEMVEFPEAYRQRISTEPVHTIYASARYPQVRLVDKDNGGKADALNAGINCARYPLVCCVDADCILQEDSLHRVVRPFLENPNTVAVGGVVRVLNGCTVENGKLGKVDLPRKLLPTIQLVEYLRAFLFGRLGWTPLNALMLISGAFGVFYKERVVAIEGFRTGTVGEDMDLVVRLHLNMRQARRPYKITFVPDPICWTEVPEDLRSLRIQRQRWQRGLAESVAPNLGFMFSRHSGTVGWIAFPFVLIFELLGPLIEVLGYAATIMLFVLGLIPLQAFLIFLFVAIGIGILLSVNAMFLEELTYHLYPKLRQQLRLFVVAILENIGYRQINSVWRAATTLSWIFTSWRESSWGSIKRSGSWQSEPKSAASDDKAGKS